jgi:hypothetical protein
VGAWKRLGKKGWAILRAHQKKILARFHNFLEIANVGEAYLIFEKISVLPKVFSTNSPKRLKTLSVFSKHFLFWQNTFQKCFESVLLQNTFVFAIRQQLLSHPLYVP